MRISQIVYCTDDNKVLSELGLDFFYFYFLTDCGHLLLLKQLVVLISNIIATKETSGSHMPFLLPGKFAHRCLPLSMWFT